MHATLCWVQTPPTPAPRRVDPTINIGVRRQIHYAKLVKEYERQMVSAGQAGEHGSRQAGPAPTAPAPARRQRAGQALHALRCAAVRAVTTSLLPRWIGSLSAGCWGRF